jgi:hypothetical protein
MLGVEMEIGHKILKSMPQQIIGLESDASADKVASTGWGWNGLTIQRAYVDNNEKELMVTVANNAVWMAAVSLSDSRFAMEQMLRDLDIAIGKEVLKLLPLKMESLSANQKEDQVTGGSGLGTGLFVQRTYATPSKTATLEIINNSPLINSLNALLAMPFVMNSADGNQKVVKVQGYKSILNKSEDTESGKLNYELQIPLENTLVSFRVDDTKEADILKMAATIPLEKIASLAN